MRKEHQRRQNEALAELSRLLPTAGVERLTDDATKRKALGLLPRRISSALMKQGGAWLLRTDVLLDDVKETRELRQDIEREGRGY
jgi:hypothetical protein